MFIKPKPKVKYASKPKTPKEVLRLQVIQKSCERAGDTAGAIDVAEAIREFYAVRLRKTESRERKKNPKPLATSTLVF